MVAFPDPSILQAPPGAGSLSDVIRPAQTRMVPTIAFGSGLTVIFKTVLQVPPMV